MQTFREYLHDILQNVDMDDKEEVTEAMQFLVRELIQYHDIAMAQDGKLQEIMNAKDYMSFCEETGKDIFKQQVDLMEDGEFKQFCIDHFDDIVGEQEK